MSPFGRYPGDRTVIGRVIIGSLLVLGGWGFVGLVTLAFTANPAPLGRTTSNGTPLWIPLLAMMLTALGVGAAGLALARSGLPSRTSVKRARPRDHAPREPRPPFNTRIVSALRRRSTHRLIIGLALVGAALLAGMSAEWMGPGPQGWLSIPTLAGAAVMGCSLIIGVVLARRAYAPLLSADGDGRPVLIFIGWPITIVAAGTATFMLGTVAAATFGEGTGLPLGICYVCGVFGFVILPTVAVASVVVFRRRGLRGFAKAFRETPWGDGI